jgi:hypothetical protein
MRVFSSINQGKMEITRPKITVYCSFLMQNRISTKLTRAHNPETLTEGNNWFLNRDQLFMTTGSEHEIVFSAGLQRRFCPQSRLRRISLTLNLIF